MCFWPIFLFVSTNKEPAMGRLLQNNCLKSDYSGQNAVLTLFWESRCPMKAWQMQEAKARLSEVVKSAESEGPQNITLHGHIGGRCDFTPHV
jgi:hypothetical protein